MGKMNHVGNPLNPAAHLAGIPLITTSVIIAGNSWGEVLDSGDWEIGIELGVR